MDTSTLDQASRLVKLILQSILFIGVAVSLYQLNWFNAAITFGIMLLTGLPTLFAKRFELVVPPVFEMATIAFLFASFFLGEIGNFYERFWWWDMALHTTSGLLLGMLGISLVWILNAEEKLNLEMSTGLISLFAFTFAVAAGALWEIFEYGMDQTFGLNMQKSGLDDTMEDLIVDALGALIVAVGGYFYLRKERRSISVEVMRRILISKRLRPKHRFKKASGNDKP